MNEAKAQQLETLLGVRVRLVTVPRRVWAERSGGGDPQPGDAITIDGRSCLLIEADERTCRVLEIEKPLTDVELALLRWAFRERAAQAPDDEGKPPMQERRLGEWAMRRLAGEEGPEAPFPEEWAGRLPEGVIPFLLLYEQSDADEDQLQNVICSFLSDDTLLVPLRRHEWLILAPDRLLFELETPGLDEDHPEETKEALASLAEGLQQAMTGEWGGDCHVAVAEPVQPGEELVSAAARLREAIALGRRFHAERRVHLPWQIHLEWLLGHLSGPALERITAEIQGASDWFSDPETVSMLELFFSLDCNVSETAKKLYIHRNTLLYRLDKFRQESGLDVRSFNDAVKVRILLLLYKMTKGK
jgi:carbohydrate diacid regulator